MDLAKTDEQKQISQLVFARQPMGRPFLAPPGIAAERVAVLRRAFMETLQDKEFLAEAARTKLEINPVSGETVQAIVREVYQTPKSVTSKVAEMVR
jgi:tripartite-type tricarboxylate transporter receptor subunit TctC